MRSKYETPFAIFSLLSAFNHFVGETYYHVTLGQPLPSYIVDLIAISLVLLGAIASLTNRTRSASGWLAAGWGFTLCLNYRSFFGRLDALSRDIAPSNGEPDLIIKILAVTLAIAALSFLFSMILARPRNTEK